MVEKKRLQVGQEIYQKLCQTLDEHDFRYETFDDKLAVKLDFGYDGYEYCVHIAIDEDLGFVYLFAELPIIVPEDKRNDMAIAVSIANNCLINGKFDFDMFNGYLIYRVQCDFIGNSFDKTILDYMIIISARAVEKYFIPFENVCNGNITIESFINQMTR